MPDIGVSKDALRVVVGLTGEFVGTTDSATITTKTISTTDNTLTASSQAAGDILVNDATKFVRLGIGTAGQPLKVNSGATNVEYGTLPVIGGGTGATTLTGILKGAGTAAITAVAAPTGAILGDSDTQNITGAKTFTDQRLKLRNPANTATLTIKNPAISADADFLLGRQITGMVVIDSSDGLAKYISNTTGAVAFTATSGKPEEAIAYAIALGAGNTYITPGSYTLHSTFAGWTIATSKTKLTFDSGANIVVPNGYTGYVFKIEPAGSLLHVLNCEIKGGFFTEAGTPVRAWTWLKLAGSVASTGISYNTFRDNIVWHASKVIHLTQTSATAFINSNAFYDLSGFSMVIGVDFDNNAGAYAGLNTNYFENCSWQSGGGVTTHGFKNICSSRHSFKDCKVFDISAGAAPKQTFTIQSDATDTIIDGGVMWVDGFYTDAGTDTWGPPKKGTLKLEKDNANLLITYRPNTGTGTSGQSGIRFDLKNASSTEYEAGRIYAEQTVTTAGAESAYVYITGRNAGAATTPFRLANDGRLFLGLNGYVVLSQTGLTNFRTITFNDANTVVVGEANTQTLTNKTYNTTDNTLTSTSRATGDILKDNGTKLERFARGAANLPLKVNSGGTDIEYGTLAVAGGGSGATTLTGVVIGNGTSAFTASNTLSGVTVDADSNTISNIRQLPEFKKTGGWYGINSATNPDGLLGGGSQLSGGAQQYVNGTNTLFTTSTTVNTLAYIRTGLCTCRQNNFKFKFGFKLTQLTACRLFIGVTESNSAPTTSADPLNVLHGIGLWYDSAVSANWKIMHNDGSGASVVDDTTVAADTNAHKLIITALESTPKFTVELKQAATIAATDITADIPSNTRWQAPQMFIETLANPGAKSFEGYYYQVVSDTLAL